MGCAPSLGPIARAQPCASRFASAWSLPLGPAPAWPFSPCSAVPRPAAASVFGASRPASRPAADGLPPPGLLLANLSPWPRPAPPPCSPRRASVLPLGLRQSGLQPPAPVLPPSPFTPGFTAFSGSRSSASALPVSPVSPVSVPVSGFRPGLRLPCLPPPHPSLRVRPPSPQPPNLSLTTWTSPPRPLRPDLPTPASQPRPPRPRLRLPPRALCRAFCVLGASCASAVSCSVCALLLRSFSAPLCFGGSRVVLRYRGVTNLLY